jgi:hypothetical protein
MSWLLVLLPVDLRRNPLSGACGSTFLSNKMRAAFVTEQESSSPTSATWNLLRDPEHTSIPVKIDISLNLMPRETEQDPLLPSSTSSDSASTESAQSAKGFKYVPTLDMVPTTRDKLSLSLIFVSRIFGR